METNRKRRQRQLVHPRYLPIGQVPIGAVYPLIVCHFQTRLGGGPAPQGGAAKTISGALAGSESEMRERVVPLGRLQEEPREYDYNRAATLQQVLFPLSYCTHSNA